MSFNVIFIVTSVLVIGLTIVLFVLLNRVLKWISSRLEKVQARGGAPEKEIPKNRRKTAIVLLALLAICINIFYVSGDLGDSVFNREFVAGELQDADITAFAIDLLDKPSSDELANILSGHENRSSEIVVDISDELSSIESEYCTECVKVTFLEMEPELRQQVNATVDSFYDYLSGETSDLNVVIPLDNLQTTLKQNLTEIIRKSSVTDLAVAKSEELQSYSEVLYQKRFSYIPDAITLSLENSSPTIGGVLEKARQFVINLELISNISFALIILLIIAVVLLLFRHFKQAFWLLGATLLITGILDYVYLAMGRGLLGQTDFLEFLPSINLWVIKMVTDVLVTISEPFVFLLLMGAAMLVISILWLDPYRKKAKSNAEI